MAVNELSLNAAWHSVTFIRTCTHTNPIPLHCNLPLQWSRPEPERRMACVALLPKAAVEVGAASGPPAGLLGSPRSSAPSPPAPPGRGQ